MRKTFHRKKAKIEPKKHFRLNEQIIAPELFVIDENGLPLGNMNSEQALAITIERGLDLVEVSPQANPPVVKIMDYGKFKYQQEKLAQKEKQKQKKTEIKIVRFSLRIGQHDKEIRQKQIEEFLENADKVKLELILKGRENKQGTRAQEFLQSLIVEIRTKIPIGIEQEITRQGGRFSIIIFSKK